MNVTGVRESEWKKDDGTSTTTYWVTIEGREKDVPCYDERAKDLAGKPIPEGWEVKQSKAGKDYLAPPRASRGGGSGGGGFAAYRNTKEGQHYEQERMDRRTAAMQAMAGKDTFDLYLAEQIYSWLRASEGAAEVTTSVTTSRKAGTDNPVRAVTVEQGPGEGTGEGAPSGSCSHPETSDTTPDKKRLLPGGRRRCIDCGEVFLP